MSLAFALIGYYLCGEQPDVIRLRLEECNPPSAIEREALTSIGVAQTARQFAETEIVQLRHVNIPMLFSSSEGCEGARMAAQKKSDDVNAYMVRSITSGHFWHSQHWKCVEVKVQ